MSTEVLNKLENLARMCKASVSVTYNEHITNHESVEKYLDYLVPNLVDKMPKDKGLMIENNRVVEVHFYPDTPVGFYHLVGYDIDKLLDEAIEIVREDSK